jgi:hypothetical protein
MINDANPTNITATVDPMAVAQAVRQLQKQDAETARASERKNLFQNKVKSLLSNEKVDKDNLAELTDLIDAKAQDLMQEWQDKQGSSGQQNIVSRYAEAVDDALSVYIDGDKPLERAAKVLKSEIMEKLSKTPDVVAASNRGEVDKRAIKNAAKEIVDSYSKEALQRDKQAKGVNLGTATQGTTFEGGIENGDLVASIEEIPTDFQRIAAKKFRSYLMTKQKMSVQDASKKAYDMAMRFDKAKEIVKQKGPGAYTSDRR